MARIEYFLVARSVSTDQATNLTSIFEVIEEITTSKFPERLHECVAVSLWRKDVGETDEDMQVMLTVTLPNGHTENFPMNFQMKGRRHRTMQRMKNLPLPSPGELRFEVSLNGEHAATHIVDVKLGDVPEDDFEVPYDVEEADNSKTQ